MAGALLLCRVQTTTSADHSYEHLKNFYDLLYLAKLTLARFQARSDAHRNDLECTEIIDRAYISYISLLSLSSAHRERRRFSFRFFDRSKFWKENFIREIGKSCRRRALETDDMSDYHYI